MGIAEHRPNEADAAGIGILASGISGCVMRDLKALSSEMDPAEIRLIR
jgi:hypothetical protein